MSHLPVSASQYNGFTIRPVTPGDTDGIHKLVSTIFADYGYIFDPVIEDRHLAEPHDFFSRARGAFWVATADGRIMGTVGAIPVPDDEEPFERIVPSCSTVGAPVGPNLRNGQLRSLYVHRDARRAGLGAHLVHLCLSWLRGAGCTGVVLWTDTQFADAHRLYERTGFVRVGVRHVKHANAYSEFKYEMPLA